MSRPLRISAFQSRDLYRLVENMQKVPAEMKRQISKFTKQAVGGIWKESVRGNSVTAMQVKVLGDTATVGASAMNVTLKAGGTVKKMSGGATVAQLAHPTEFGVKDREKVSTVRGKSRNGKAYTYSRRTNRQFKLYRKAGYTVYPAASESIPRIMSLWIKTAMRTIADSINNI